MLDDRQDQRVDAAANADTTANRQSAVNGEPASPAANTAPKSDLAPDPFDPASLRLRGDLTAAMGVRKALLSVPVRKPDKTWFLRVHPDEAYSLQTAVIELKEEKETYLVARELWPALAGEATFGSRALFTAIARQGVMFLWPVRLPGPDGKLDEWSRTALAAAQLARTRWVRVTANMALGAYDVWEGGADLSEPVWPDTPFSDLLRVAFGKWYIDAPDHPVLRRLRGEV
jgi:hypothetical protein